MKKVVLLLVSLGLVILSACGNDSDVESTEEKAVENDGIEEEVDPADEGPTTDNPDLIEDAGTDDPIEFIESQGDLLLQDGANEYEINNIYTSDETDDDGFNTYEDGDFKMRYAIVETENVADNIEDEGNNNLQIVGEINNETDDDYTFDENRFFIKTDENEKSELSFDLNGAGEADQRSKFIDDFPLEYDIPDEFTLTMIDPSLEGEGDDVVFGDDWNRKFDEAFEEFKDENTVQELEFTK